MKKIVLGVVAISIIAAIAYTVATRGKNGDALAVEIEPVQRREIVETVAATGKIQPNTQVNISADVSAKITQLPVKEGDWVEKGTLLVELDRERYLAAVESSEANQRASRANADLARENMVKAGKDLARTEELFAKNLESQAVLDTVAAAAEVEKARYQATLNQVEQATASLKQMQDDLAKTTIYAPLSGTVSQLNKEAGEIALGSQFQEDVIMVLSNLTAMEALVEVDENDIVSVALGDAARVEVDALPDLEFAGEVTEIANTAMISGSGTTDQKTEFEVKITITDPSPELRPGMTASAKIVTEVREDALSVPIQCVAVRTPEQIGMTGPTAGEEGGEPRFVPDKEGFVEIVWVVEDSVAHARQVVPGVQGETHIEIISGLADGDEVVTGAYRAISRDLKDGAEVTAGEASPARLGVDGHGFDGPRRGQDLRHGQRRGSGAPRRLLRGPGQRVRRHHGTLGIREVDDDEHHRLSRHPDLRRVHSRRRGRQRPVRGPARGDPQPEDRFRLPDLQPPAPLRRLPQRRAASDIQRHGPVGEAPTD